VRRAQKVVLGVVAVVALGGVVFNFVRPVRLDSLVCTGWGGAAKWLIKDGPDGQHHSVRLGAATEQLYRQDVLDPCDAKARSNLATSWQGSLIILVVGLFAVWAIGWFRRPVPGEQEALDDDP
jgi:hypothetical protein